MSRPHFSKKKQQEITETRNCNLILCFKWYSVEYSVSCLVYLVKAGFFYICLDITIHDKSKAWKQLLCKCIAKYCHASEAKSNETFWCRRTPIWCLQSSTLSGIVIIYFKKYWQNQEMQKDSNSFKDSTIKQYSEYF